MAVDGADEPDLTNLPWFLSHLELRDREAAVLARRLVTGGWQVRSFAGPVQMDVWELVLERGGWLVRFGIERGVSDHVIVKRVDGPADEPWRSLAAVPELAQQLAGPA